MIFSTASSSNRSIFWIHWPPSWKYSDHQRSIAWPIILPWSSLVKIINSSCCCLQPRCSCSLSCLFFGSVISSTISISRSKSVDLMMELDRRSICRLSCGSNVVLLLFFSLIMMMKLGKTLMEIAFICFTCLERKSRIFILRVEHFIQF